jgi:ribose/xylose/arabinose/galactoside ABC-type transport system permease subunit
VSLSARLPARSENPALASLGALIGLVLLSAIFTPHFATTGNLLNVLFQVSTVALVAIGMTFVIATAGVDLSVGSVMALASATAAVTVQHGVVLAVVAAVTVAAAVGALNGVLIAWLRVQPIVVTLATLIAARGLAQVISHDGELVTIGDPTLLELGRGAIGALPYQVIIAALAVAAAAFVIRSMSFGRYVLAVGGNRTAARLAGVPVFRTVTSVYVMSAVLAAIAGLIVAGRLGASDAAKIGQNMELDAIAAVVVGGSALAGGRATILGTVVGALIMQVIATSLNMLLVPYAWTLAFKAGIILLAVYLQRPARV